MYLSKRTSQPGGRPWASWACWICIELDASASEGLAGPVAPADAAVVGVEIDVVAGGELAAG